MSKNVHDKAQVFNREGHDRLEQFNQGCVGSALVDVLESGLEAFSQGYPYFCGWGTHGGLGCAGEELRHLQQCGDTLQYNHVSSPDRGC